MYEVIQKYYKRFKRQQRHTDLEDTDDLSGIIPVLGELGPGAVIMEEGMANLFGRHVTSVKRAVQRGELPPPTRLFGQKAWTVRSIISHIEDRLEQQAMERERLQRRLEKLSP